MVRVSKLHTGRYVVIVDGEIIAKFTSNPLQGPFKPYQDAMVYAYHQAVTMRSDDVYIVDPLTQYCADCGLPFYMDSIRHSVSLRETVVDTCHDCYRIAVETLGV